MTSGFYQQKGRWHVDGMPLAAVAQQHGTPCYVYSQSIFAQSYQNIKNAFLGSGAQIHYAVKANDNLTLLGLLAQWGSGFDIVSVGELHKVLAAGGQASAVIFSGVGKKNSEIETALTKGIKCFNVESVGELDRIIHCAKSLNKVAPVAIRLTLEVDGDTHQYLTTGTTDTKFGVSLADVDGLVATAHASPFIEFLGFSCHVGSQISDQNIYLALCDKMATQVQHTEAMGIPVSTVDMGGGFAVDYQTIEHGARPLSTWQKYDAQLARHFTNKQIIIEPGRSVIAAAGVLLTTVEYVKHSPNKQIWVVDAAMNNLIRPALYGAHHPIINAQATSEAAAVGDVVGPICESADFLAKNHPLAAQVGDLLVIFNVGAYGEVLSSNYNSRLKPPSLLVHNGNAKIIRQPQTIDDLLKPEQTD